MANWYLIRPQECPPGEFQFPGHAQNPSLEDLAKRVADRRRANGKPRGSIEEATQDILNANAKRLGYHKRFWYSDERPVAVVQAKRSGGCSTCGAKVHR